MTLREQRAIEIRVWQLLPRNIPKWYGYAVDILFQAFDSIF
jgi:hypothetical protein